MEKKVQSNNMTKEHCWNKGHAAQKMAAPRNADKRRVEVIESALGNGSSKEQQSRTCGTYIITLGPETTSGDNMLSQSLMRSSFTLYNTVE